MKYNATQAPTARRQTTLRTRETTAREQMEDLRPALVSTFVFPASRLSSEPTSTIAYGRLLLRQELSEGEDEDSECMLDLLSPAILSFTSYKVPVSEISEVLFCSAELLSTKACRPTVSS